MITDKLIKEYDKEIIEWYFPEAKTSFLGVVLIDKEKGVSVKPYFDEKERKRFIQIALDFNKYCTVTDIEKLIARPDFCFVHITKRQKVDIIRKILAAGNMRGIVSYGNNPSCPFA